MITIEDLEKLYGKGVPIFPDDLKERTNCSYDIIRKSLSLLASSGKVRRFSRGVYYLAELGELGEVRLNPEIVVEQKYLGTSDAPIGTYAGLTLLNRLGLTNQVPNVIEIVTNNEATRKRTIQIGRQSLILRSSRLELNIHNIKTVEILEAVGALDQIKERHKDVLSILIQKNKISFKQLNNVIVTYPKKTLVKLVESGLMDEFASE